MANTNLNKNVGSLLTAAEVNLLLAVDSNGNFGIGTTAPKEFLEIAANKNATNAGANPIFSVENLRTSSGTSAAEILFRTYETDATSHNRAVIRASANASVNNNCGIFEIFTANSAGTMTKALDVDEKQFLSLVNTPTLQTDASYALRLNEGYELGVGSYKNLTSSRPSTTTVDIDADHVIVVDDTNKTFMKVSVNVTIDSATSGANGLDSGSYAASTWYYNWIIAKTDGTVAGLHSLSATSPTMPAGYTLKKLVGAVYCTSISPVVFREFYQVDDVITYALKVNVITNGNSTSITSIPLATAVPSIAKDARGYVNMDNGGLSGKQIITRIYNTSTGGGVKSYNLRAGLDSTWIELASDIIIRIITAQTLYYDVLSGTYGDLDISGFSINI